MTTSEPDSTSRRRPPTIELTATEVEAEKKASAQEAGVADAEKDGSSSGHAPESAPRGSSGGRFAAHAIGAVIGAVLVGAILAALWIGGLVPSREALAPPPATEAAKPAVTDEISAQLKKIESAITAQRPEPSAERLAAVEAQTKSLGDSVAALNRRVDDAAGAVQNALAQAKAAAAAADGAKNATQAAVQHSDLDTLTNRIAALERSVKSLTDEVTRRTSSANDRVARLIVITEALRAAVERGASYQSELSAAKSLGADQGLVTQLEPFAAEGLPNAATLAHQLSALTPALLQASGPATSDGSFLGRLENNAQRLVRITPIDAPVGDDPASVIARINVDAAHADIAAALADIAKLPDATKSITGPWVKKAEARNAAIAASRRIAADAFAALDKPGSQ